MAEAKDQAPQYQNPADTVAITAVPVGAEHIDQTKYRETPMGKVTHKLTVPDGPTPTLHEPAHFVENVDGFQVIKPEAKKGITKTQKLIGAVAGAALLAGGVVFGAFKGAESGSKSTEHIAGSNIGNAAPAMPGIEGLSGDSETDYSKVDAQSLTVDQFYNDAIYPKELRIKWASEIVKQRELQAYNDLNKILTDHGNPPLKPLVEPNTDNTGNEIMVQHNVVDYIASTDPNPTEGAKILAAAQDYLSPSEISSLLAKGPIVTFNTVPQTSDTNLSLESRVFKNTVVGDYAPNGVQSKIVININGITSAPSQTVEQFIGGRYITTDTKRTSDPDWILHPESISDK